MKGSAVRVPVSALQTAWLVRAPLLLAAMLILGLATAGHWLPAASVPSARHIPKQTAQRSWAGALPLPLAEVAAQQIGARDRAAWATRHGNALEVQAGALRASFAAGGASVTAATGALGIVGVGVGGARGMVWQARVSPQASRNVVTYAYRDLVEVFRSGPYGIEQTFIVPRPAGASAGTVRVRMRTDGNLEPSLVGSGLVLRTRDGTARLRYEGLKVLDASGKTLPAHLVVQRGVIEIDVRTAGARFPIQIDPFVEQAEIPGIGRQNFGGEGSGVALSADGNTALIGEWEYAGEAFVFTRSGSTWSLQARLAQPRGATREFGYSVALSADGNTALVAQWSAGAWVFTRLGTKWTLQTEEPLQPKEGEPGGFHGFGNSAALSLDGNTAIIGATSSSTSGNSGAAWMFTRSGSTWSRETMLKPADESISSPSEWGRPDKVALSGAGGVALLGSETDGENTGGAWIYEHTASGWVEQGKLTGPGETGPGLFGSAVALSRDGSTALIGARYDAYGGGGAWAFARDEGGWKPQGNELIPALEPTSGGFGESVALSANGTTALIGGPNNGPEDEGAVWVFRRSAEHWWQEQKLSNPVPHRNGETGSSVALSEDATTALVSAPGETVEGAAWVFTGPSAAGPEPPSRPVPAPTGPQWSSLGGNPQRTATVDSPKLEPPFAAWWSHTFPVPPGSSPRKVWEGGKEVELPNEEVVGYPLLGNGMVYVVRAATGNDEGTELDAFSQKSGELVWSKELAGGSTVFTALDGNRLFTDGSSEGVVALNALTGEKLWSRESAHVEPLVASEGVLYYVAAFIGAKTIAVAEATGRTLWEGEMFNSTGAGPVLGDGDVYVMGDVDEDAQYEKSPAGWAFDAKTGKLMWEDAAEGSGDRGSSWTTILAEGHLWTSESGTNGQEWGEGAIVNPLTGASEGSYKATVANSPIIDGADVLALAEHYECPGVNIECRLVSTTLTATDSEDGHTLWTFNGDGRLDSGLIRVNDDILVGSASGNLYALDEQTGAELWKSTMPDGFRPENGDKIGTPTGMAANGDVLAVAAGDSLTLMTSGGPPAEPSPTPESPSPESTSPAPESPLGPSSGTPSMGSNVGPGATTNSSAIGPTGAVAGFSHERAPTCAVAGGIRTHSLRGGRRRLLITVRCGASGRMTLTAGYARKASGGSTHRPVTLVRTVERVRAGTTTVYVALNARAARLLAAHRPLRLSVSLVAQAG
mgnify:CR=1 FL=1